MENKEGKEIFAEEGALQAQLRRMSINSSKSQGDSRQKHKPKTKTTNILYKCLRHNTEREAYCKALGTTEVHRVLMVLNEVSNVCHMLNKYVCVMLNNFNPIYG